MRALLVANAHLHIAHIVRVVQMCGREVTRDPARWSPSVRFCLLRSCCAFRAV